MKSWKTTLGGVLGASALPLKSLLPAQWSWVADAVASFGVLLVGWAARDNNVSSEAAGAK